MNTLTLKTNINCGNCVAKVTPALNALAGITHWEVDTANPDKVLKVEGNNIQLKAITAAIEATGFKVFGPVANSTGKSIIPAFWSDKPTWNRAGFNTLNCLIGCSLGDFGMMIFLQVYFPATNPLIMMALAMVTGLATSVLLESAILKVREQFSWTQAFQTAMGMSFISMLVMELSENVTDYVLTGNAVPLHHPFYWQAMAISTAMGFLVPLPYNYFKLKKYGKACH